MIKSLTSLRIVFALMVFFSHCSLDYFPGADGFLTGLYNHLFYEGYIGVSFFFILSGFVISLAYTERLANHTVTKKSYFIARFARIYPLHILTLILVLPLHFREGAVRLLSNVLLLQSYIPDMKYYFSFNSVSWSISDEFFFYAMFPALAWFLSKAKNKAYLLVVVMVPVLIFFTPAELQHKLFYIHPFIRVVDFFVGMLLYRMYAKGMFKPADGKQGTLYEWGAIALLGVFLLLHEYVPQGYRYSCYYWIPMAVIILVFAYQQGAISRLLSNRYLVLGGEISFAFYMLHHMVIAYGMLINQKFHLLSNPYLIILTLLIISLVGSYIIFRFFEMPITKWVKARSK